MDTDVLLRPGVLFRSGAIEVAGRHYPGVTDLGAVAGTTDGGRPARVRVLVAPYPVDLGLIARRERLPALAVVPVQTQYLHADRDILFTLFALSAAVEDGAGLDPTRTVALPLHGATAVDEDGRLSGGEPCVPGPGDEWITLGPAATADVVRWARGPGGERPTAVVNTGCFSSTPRGKAGPTFNEELAARLADDGIAVYGPPHAGVVTAATGYLAWRDRFSQSVESGGSAQSVPIRFGRIAPARRVQVGVPAVPTGAVPEGVVVVTNDTALAGEVAGFPPDFARPRPHGFERDLME